MLCSSATCCAPMWLYLYPTLNPNPEPNLDRNPIPDPTPNPNRDPNPDPGPDPNPNPGPPPAGTTSCVGASVGDINDITTTTLEVPTSVFAARLITDGRLRQSCIVLRFLWEPGGPDRDEAGALMGRIMHRVEQELGFVGLSPVTTLPRAEAVDQVC